MSIINIFGLKAIINIYIKYTIGSGSEAPPGPAHTALHGAQQPIRGSYGVYVTI
jgi:hypothetical protein